MKLRMPSVYVRVAVMGVVATALVLGATADTAQSHGTGPGFPHRLAFGGSLSHWSDGGMDYKLQGTFPTGWSGYINQAATHMKNNTLATKLGASTTSSNLVSIGGWPPIISSPNLLPGPLRTCTKSGKFAGSVMGEDSIACAWPVTSSGAVDFDITGNLTNNLQGVAIAFDEADVYQGTGTNRTVRSGWSANSGAKIKRVAAHEFGHALGFFSHLGSGNLMHGTAPQYNLSTNDKWSINRLYLHTTEAATACMTEIKLSGVKNAGGSMYPGSLSSSGTICPSTAYNGLARYYKLDASGAGGREFRVWNDSKQDVKQYVQSISDFNPYAGGAVSSPKDINGNTLVQVASGDRSKTYSYQLKVRPHCVDPFGYSIRSATYPTAYTRALGASDCVSSKTSRGYADFYNVKVTSSTPTVVTIEMKSNNIDTYLYLRNGKDEQSATEIAYHDDINGNVNTNSRIVKKLAKGDYTIEATSSSKLDVGAYTLTVSSSPPAPPPTPTPMPTPTPAPPSGDASLIKKFDTNMNGKIDRSEVIAAINNYLAGRGNVTRSEVIRLINLYL